MMDFDGWVSGYKVRAFDWIDGKSIYLHIAYYRPGANLEKPPARERSFLIPKSEEETLIQRFNSVVSGLDDTM